MARSAVLLAVGLLLADRPAQARSRGRPAVVILPLAVDETVDGELAAAAQRTMRTAAERLGTADVVGPAWLRQRIKNPHELIEECGPDNSCLWRLGRRAGASEVLASRAIPDAAGGVQIALRRLGSGGTIIDSATAAASDAAEVERILWAEIQSMLAPPQGAPAADLELPLAALEPTAAEEIEPLEPLAAPASAGGDTPAPDGVDIAEPADDTGDLELVALEPLAAQRGQSLPLGRYLAFGGLASAGAGALLLGAAAIYGARAARLATPEPGASQRELATQQDDQNRAYDRGRGFMWTGSMLATVGLASFAIDAWLYGGSIWRFGAAEPAP